MKCLLQLLIQLIGGRKDIMSKFSNSYFYLEVAKGNIPKHSIVHKFGAGTVSTTVITITQSGFDFTNMMNEDSKCENNS